MRELNAKDFAIDKIEEIKQLCNDLKYTENKQLRIVGIERINYLAQGIEEHLEYLDIIGEVQNETKQNKIKNKNKIELDDMAVNLLLFMKDKEIRFEGEEIITWIKFYDVDEFCELFTAGLFDEGGLDIKLQQDCIALDLKEIVDYYFIGEENEYMVEKLRKMSE